MTADCVALEDEELMDPDHDAMTVAMCKASGMTKVEDEDDEESLTQDELERKRQENIRSLLDNRLEVQRKPLLPKLLTVRDAEVVLRSKFKSPHPTSASFTDNLRKRLLARKKFVPWGNGKLPNVFVVRISPEVPSPVVEQMPQEPQEDFSAVEPLVLWEPPEGAGGRAVTVDPMLTTFLRPHQKEGVQFMFECVAGLRKYDGKGCILADDMGLGKTLQGITLLWTLLQNGHDLLGGSPLARRIIIVCPTSLVSNWDNECQKWLKGRLRTLPLCESSRDDVISSVYQFLSPQNYFQVLIVSYETFRLHADKFRADSACDLLICDEAHRLKNDQTLTNKALDSLSCRRRVLLSGTPMQNHLDEFYAMVNFCNPGVLGSPSEFRRLYETPILAGREPSASEAEMSLGTERSMELSAIVNEFILRRTNALLSAHLPPKVVLVVCCKMTELQQQVYWHFLESNAARQLLDKRKAARVLSAITALKKLCNHPKLIYDTLHSSAKKEGADDWFQNCGELFPPGLFDNGRPGRGGLPLGWELLSGKMAVLSRMLHLLYTTTDDRIVIVSNYTQTLDLFATLCRERSYPFLRLDGSTSISKRQKLVKKFNDKSECQFVFLLSSKAGGCGLNLIGGNRLVLFDPDWNPANDKQAAARVWRDGQQKRVYVYRFLTTGTIEEKVYQRQLNKEGLQSLVNQSGNQSGGANSAMMSMEELRDLFTLRPDTLSDTYDSMCTTKDEEGKGQAVSASTTGGTSIHTAQVGAPKEEDLHEWGHHSSISTVPDVVTQQSGGDDVTFVFSCEVEGKALDDEEPQAAGPTAQQGDHKPSNTAHAAAAAPSRLTAPRSARKAGKPWSASGPVVQQPHVGASAGVTGKEWPVRALAPPIRRPLEPLTMNAVAGRAAAAAGDQPMARMSAPVAPASKRSRGETHSTVHRAGSDDDFM